MGANYVNGMPFAATYRPDPRFEALGDDFSDIVAPATFPLHKLRWRNQRWAQRVGLAELTDAEWESAFAKFEPLPGNMQSPRAMRYHGHQFQSYNPQIGDGRGFLYAQLRDDQDRLLDLATKGSGQTPYSRFGDGRLTLKGAVREILAAEMLEALGVYTSKAFSVFETGEALQRHDEPSPTRAGVMVRLGHSHVRIGTFQRLAYFERADLMQQLVDHCAEAYYPHLLAIEGQGRAAGLMTEVVRANARLAASWMAAGFVHGVLNTDNMNVAGESFDYGPWRFLPEADPFFVAAYFDEGGLYRYGRQPQATAWNLAQLGGSLSAICDSTLLQAALDLFSESYREAMRAAMFARLGLEGGDLSEDLYFLSELFDWMAKARVSWPQFFHDWFCGAAARAEQSPQASSYADASFAELRKGLCARTPHRPERLAHAVFQAPTPPTLVIEQVEALWAPIDKHDDWSLFEAKLADIAALREALAG
jgi:uncharacterized protein YdiU (UPF0061 family)